MTTLHEILEAYNWFDHVDGPKFVETHRDEFRSSGHWLFLPGTVSYFHKVLNNDELWVIHHGRVRLHILDPQGNYHEVALGTHSHAGERPVVSIPKGHWQAAEIPERTAFAFGTNI